MIPAKNIALLDTLPKVAGAYFENASLAKLIWFRAGGPADILFRPKDESDLQTFLENLVNDIPVTMIGVGSNLLVRDGGVRGVVIKLGKPFGNIKIDGNLVTAGAGATDVAVAHSALGACLSGLEFMRGIPGTVGGALRTNAGAYGSEMADIFENATAIDRNGKIHTLGSAEMGFSYRHTKASDDWIFTSATFKAVPGDKNEIKTKMDDIQNAREATQPMRVRTGGSTFKNPEGKKAWQLIDAAGCRGLEIGGAKVSDLHCNFLINSGDASSQDLEALGEEVRGRVKQNSGESLEWEIERIGDV